MNPKCFVVLVALVAQVYSYPSTRERRQAAAYAGPDGAVAGAGAGGKETAGGVTVDSGSSSSSTSTSNSAGTNLGSRLRDFVPWRVFAGLNLGQGARVGAGCAGLNCGVRLGDYSVGTGQLFGNRGSYEYDDDYNQGGGYYNGGGYAPYYSYGRNPPSYSSSSGYNNQQYFPSGAPYYSSGSNFLLDPFRFVQQAQQQNFQNIASFGRIGGGNGGYGGASTSTFGSSSNGGRPSYSSTSVHVGPDGKVTTVESGSDTPDRITTGRIGNGNGVYAASGTHVDSDGNVNSFRNVGALH